MPRPFDPYAFPSSETLNQGMSLRDYFAAAAMTGLQANANPNYFTDDVSLARYAYSLADAMLAEREK